MLDFESQKMSLPIWTLAALGSAAMHLGIVVLALEYMREDDLEAALGAPAVAIGIELVAPRLEPIELPPGPITDAAISSPRFVKQTITAEPVRAVPTLTDDPERIVVPVDTSKPEQDKSEFPPPPIILSVESIATEATAPPTSELLPVSSHSLTPTQGTGESPERVRAAWQKDLIAHFDRHKRYPVNGSLQGAQTLVAFTINEMGHVLSSAIVRGSGDAAFDAAALAMIGRSDPVPKPPLLVAREGLSFTLPVIFRAKRGN